MTYDLGSDLPIPYGWIDPINFKRIGPPKKSEFSHDKWLQYNNSEVIRKLRNGDEDLVKLVKRPKKVAWLMSREGARSRRDNYVNLMQKHINIDIYGEKGLSCGKRQ